MAAHPADRLIFAATAAAAALLRGRVALNDRVESAADAEASDTGVVLLATLDDELAGDPSPRDVRIAVVDHAEAWSDDARFDDYVFPTATRSEIVFRAWRALLRKTPAPVRLHPMSLEVCGRLVPLSLTEHQLVARLLERPGAPISRADLERALGEGAGPRLPGAPHEDSRALDAHIYRLRRKLRGLPGVHLDTLRQRGFALRVEDPAGAEAHRVGADTRPS